MNRQSSLDINYRKMNEHVKDNDNVNENVKDNDNVNENKKTEFKTW